MSDFLCHQFLSRLLSVSLRSENLSSWLRMPPQSPPPPWSEGTALGTGQTDLKWAFSDLHTSWSPKTKSRKSRTASLRVNSVFPADSKWIFLWHRHCLIHLITHFVLAAIGNFGKAAEAYFCFLPFLWKLKPRPGKCQDWRAAFGIFTTSEDATKQTKEKISLVHRLHQQTMSDMNWPKALNH